MVNKQEQRSEETRKGILAAAGRLFAERGYGAVTMREIAKEAGCSHTTIYIYYKDKEELLHQLSVPSLLEFKQNLDQALAQEALPPEAKLRHIGREFIKFCLMRRSMYELIFLTESARVDQEPTQELNRLRNGLFDSLRATLGLCLPDLPERELLSYSRMYFYMIHGVAATYHQSKESYEQLMERLGTTLEEMLDILLLGMERQTNRS